MDRRLKLHEELKKLLGSQNVYFQPPESIKMKYPALIYSRENIENRFADNNVYKTQKIYKVTVVDSDPDSKIVDRLAQMKTARFNTHYVADGLNHDVFIIYY